MLFQDDDSTPKTSEDTTLGTDEKTEEAVVAPETEEQV